MREAGRHALQQHPCRQEGTEHGIRQRDIEHARCMGPYPRHAPQRGHRKGFAYARRAAGYAQHQRHLEEVLAQVVPAHEGRWRQAASNEGLGKGEGCEAPHTPWNSKLQLARPSTCLESMAAHAAGCK